MLYRYSLLVALALLFVGAPLTLQSQSLSGHAGFSFPTGDYGDDDSDDNDSGGAGIGVNVGLNYHLPLSDDGLGVLLGADLVFHTLKGDFKDDIEDSFANDVDVSHSNYINVPLSAALEYMFPAGSVELGINAGIAFNLLKVTNFKAEQGNAELEVVYDISSRLGLRFGGSITLPSGVTIAGTVFAIGEHDIEGEGQNGGQDFDVDTDQTVSFFNLTIGKTF